MNMKQKLKGKKDEPRKRCNGINLPAVSHVKAATGTARRGATPSQKCHAHFAPARKK
jgi:hypothetical protein